MADNHTLKESNAKLKRARDLLQLCILIDKSGQCTEEVEEIDKYLGL